MAAVVLLPAYVALGVTESAENSFPSPIKLFVNNLSQLTSQFAFCEPINIADDQIGVNAFCGTVTLILAVLLIVLGLNIVFHSFSAYKKAEHNSEAKI